MRRALELGVKEEGRTGVPIAVTMLNLGTLLRAQEELEEARALLEEVNADEEKTWGTGRLYTLGELGDLYAAMGDHRRARDFLDRAIAIGDSDRSRPEQSDLAAPLTYSGRLFLAEGRPADALAPLERALRIRQRTLGEKHNSTAETLVEIARAKGALEGSGAAEPLLLRALAIQRETLAADHRYLVPTLVTLGEVVLARGDTDQAQKLLREAREIARRRLPEHHSQRRQAEAAANLLAK
jgi:tetratricopeptide (TPR) repeat protein